MIIYTSAEWRKAPDRKGALYTAFEWWHMFIQGIYKGSENPGPSTENILSEDQNSKDE